VACKNSDKKTTSKETAPATSADSLMIDIEDGHNVGMAKMSKLSLMQNAVQQVLDSIAALPDKAQEATEPYKRVLNGLMEDLKSAKDNMYKWMDEFNRDSAINDLQQRINYLTEEKMKVAKVKETILNTLQKADSLLKSRF
jgi:hypothetical protein